MLAKNTRAGESLRLFRRSLIYQTKEYFQNSTLHGVRYIAESGRPIGEKFMWFCFTAIGTVTALIIIMSLWEKFQTNPTITGLDTDFHNQQVMFPTTVVCPNNPYDEEKVATSAEMITNSDPEEGGQVERLLKSLTQLSFKNIETVWSIRQNLTRPTQEALTKKSLRSWVFNVHLSSTDIFSSCTYRDDYLNCTNEFQSILTAHGFCYAFNSKFKSTENADTSIEVAHDLYETDKKWSLYFMLNGSAKIYIFSHEEGFGQDFTPQLRLNDEQQNAEILISKKSTYTTPDARQLSITQRKCIFPDEVELSFFKGKYTFTSCMKECRMRIVINLCKCLPSFYTIVPSIQVCHFKDFPCLIKYKQNITNSRQCLRCELSCSKTVYDVEKLNKVFEKASDKGINVEFLTWPLIRYKREVLFGWVDLLVSFGGIAGLFLGFSLLSGVEIVYYFTMRACCMLYKNREELYAIEEEIRKKPPPRLDMSLGPIRERRRKSVRVANRLNPIKFVEKAQPFQDFVPTKKAWNAKQIHGRRSYKNFSKPLFKRVKVSPTVPKTKLQPVELFYLP